MKHSGQAGKPDLLLGFRRFERIGGVAQLRDRIAHGEKRVRAGSRSAVETPHSMRSKIVHHGAAGKNQAHRRGQHTPSEASHPCVLHPLTDEPSAPRSRSGGKLGQQAKPDKASFVRPKMYLVRPGRNRRTSLTQRREDLSATDETQIKHGWRRRTQMSQRRRAALVHSCWIRVSSVFDPWPESFEVTRTNAHSGHCTSA